jgi:hypothetical protein
MKFCVICGQALVASADVGAAAPAAAVALPDAVSAETPALVETLTPDPIEIPSPAPVETPAPVSSASETLSRDTPAGAAPPPVEKQYAEAENEMPEEPEVEPQDDDDTEIIEITKKPKIKLFRNIPVAILSALIGVLLFSLILCGGISAALRYALYPENIEGMVASIDFLSLPAPREISDIMNIDTNSLGDAVYTFAEPTGLTKDDVDYIYENSTFRDGFASILTGYADFLRDGIVPPDITTEDIKALFDDNLKVMNEAFGKDMTNSNIAAVYANIELSEDLLKDIDIHSLTAGRDQTINVLRSLISYPAFIAEAAIILLLIILIGRINKKAAPALMVTGVAGVSASVLTALSVLLFSNQIIGLPETEKIIIGSILSFIAPVIYIGSAAAALIGVIFIVISKASVRKTTMS